MKVKIKLIHQDAVIPEYKTKGAAGCDVHSVEEVIIKPGESVLISTGLQFEVPDGHFIMVAPRSSLSIKKNLDMPNSVGIIDSDYRGELLFPLRNLGVEEINIPKGERVAQLIFLSFENVTFEEVDSLTETERGTGGFGSTGKF